jgi:type I restriction enzyme S subunit
VSDKNNKTLKPGWRRVKFGEVVRLSKARSQDPLADGIERYVGLEHLEPGDLRIRSWGSVADGVTFTSVFQPGQVLFGKRRAYQRKVAVADFSGVCSGDIYVLETKDAQVLLPELLPFICQTDAFFDHAVGTSAGSLSPRTNWTSLADFEFALPPMNEQTQIARALSANEHTRRTHEDSWELGKRLGRSLTATLLGVNSEGIIEDVIRGNATTTETGIPIRRVSEICVKHRQGVQVGPFGGSVSSKYFVPEGVPVLKINNISKDFLIDLADQVFLSEEHAQELGDRYRVQGGDLVTAAQATIGRSALVPKELEGAVISQHLIRVAPDPMLCLPSWLLLCFSSALVVRQLHSVTQGGTRAGLNTQDVAGIRLPMPDIDAQKKILLVIEEHRKSMSAIQGRLDQSKELARAMNAAFMGG